VASGTRIIHKIQPSSTRGMYDHVLELYINVGMTVTYKCISDIWNAQIKERQVHILEKITKNVGLQVGLHQKLVTSDVTLVANPSNYMLEDLSDSDGTEVVLWPTTRRTPNIQPETPHRKKVRFCFNYLSNLT
jgi:hypothetical protein